MEALNYCGTNVKTHNVSARHYCVGKVKTRKGFYYKHRSKITFGNERYYFNWRSIRNVQNVKTNVSFFGALMLVTGTHLVWNKPAIALPLHWWWQREENAAAENPMNPNPPEQTALGQVGQAEIEVAENPVNPNPPEQTALGQAGGENENQSIGSLLGLAGVLIAAFVIPPLMSFVRKNEGTITASNLNLTSNPSSSEITNTSNTNESGLDNEFGNNGSSRPYIGLWYDINFWVAFLFVFVLASVITFLIKSFYEWARNAFFEKRQKRLEWLNDWKSFFIRKLRQCWNWIKKHPLLILSTLWSIFINAGIVRFALNLLMAILNSSFMASLTILAIIIRQMIKYKNLWDLKFLGLTINLRYCLLAIILLLFFYISSLVGQLKAENLAKSTQEIPKKATKSQSIITD